MKKLFVIIFPFIIFSSCESYFGDVNENPNSNEVTITTEELLPNILVRLAFVLGGDVSMYTSIFTQQVEGTARCAAINNYSGISPALFNIAWNDVFAGTLSDLNVVKSIAEAENKTQLLGVVNMLTAYTWMMATDIWGDLPYKEALNGVVIQEPTYDSQSFIYEQILELLQLSQTQLSASPENRIPTDADLIYSGNASQWLRASYALEIRAHLHLGQVDNSHYEQALAIMPMAFQDMNDDMRLPFAGQENAAPWFQFNRDRTGDVEFHPQMRRLLRGLNDPRVNIYDSPFSSNMHLFLTADQELALLTYSELKFIEAECLLRTGANSSRILDAYLSGIKASFEFLNIGILYDDYIEQNIIVPSSNVIELEDILLQKYIALWTEPESFTDWRRTSIPDLTPSSGNAVPRRFNYAQSEYDHNRNTPELDLFDRIWWDR